MKKTILATGGLNASFTLLTLYCVWLNPHQTKNELTVCANSQAYIYNVYNATKCL